MTARRKLTIDAVPAHSPEIGRRLAEMDDARRRTLRAVKDVTPDVLDWTPPGGGNSIATLLAHVATIEADWLYHEVVVAEIPADLMALFPPDVRDADGRLSRVAGVPLERHLATLEVVRARLVDVFRDMTDDDFRRPRALTEYDVTPEWVLHHLSQHEAEHRGQIAALRLAARAALAR